MTMKYKIHVHTKKGNINIKGVVSPNNNVDGTLPEYVISQDFVHRFSQFFFFFLDINSPYDQVQS